MQILKFIVEDDDSCYLEFEGKKYLSSYYFLTTVISNISSGVYFIGMESDIKLKDSSHILLYSTVSDILYFKTINSSEEGYKMFVCGLGDHEISRLIQSYNSVHLKFEPSPFKCKISIK